MFKQCHYPQDLIEKHIKIRIDQVKSRKRSNVDTDTQNEIFDKHNTIFLAYFGQISKTIQFMLKKGLNPYKFQNTVWDGRTYNTRVEEHKRNLGRKCNCHNVLSDHRKKYADHDFDGNNVKILHSASNKVKREFMEMLYIKREGTYSMNLKTDLVKYNGCYDSMMDYI